MFGFILGLWTAQTLVPLLGIYPKNTVPYFHKDTSSTMFIAASLIITRKPLNQGMDKENVLGLDNGVLLSC